MPAFLAGLAAWAFGIRILPKKMRNLQEKLLSSWLDDRAAGYFMVLGGIRLVVREVQLDILHRNVRAGRNENKRAMVPIHQNVLAVFAAAVVAVAVAAADAFAAAAVARGAVKPIVTVARETVEPIAADDDDVDDLCRRVCRERCHGLHGPVKSRRRWPPPRGFAPVARAWVPPAPPFLALESSTRVRASPSSSGSVSVVISKNKCFFQHQI